VRRFGASVALILLIAYLQFVGGGWAGIYDSRIRLTSLALITLVVVCWVIAATRNPALRPASALRVPILFGLGSFALSTLASREPRVSVEYLAYAVVLVTLYLLLVQLFRNSFLARRLAGLAVVLLVVIAGAYLVAVASRWIQWWGLVGNLTFPPLRPAFESFLYGNPSSVMAVVVLLLFSAVAAVGLDGRGHVLLVSVLVLLAGAVTLASGSRAGWLALAATVLVLMIVAVARPGTRHMLAEAARSLASRRSLRIVFAAALVAGAAGLFILGPAILRRVQDPGQILRGGFVLIALRVFAEAPLLGTGPGTWVAQRIRFTNPSEIDFYIPHAHNMYAQVLAEFGVVGVVAGVVLFVWLVQLVREALRDTDPIRRRWGYAALGAAVYFGMHSTLDIFTNMPAIMFPLVIPIAWLDAHHVRQVPVRAASPGQMARISSRVLGAVSLVIVTAAIGVLVATEIPAVRGQQAVDLANDGHWTDAVPLASAAVNGDPGMPALRFTLGLALDRIGDHAGSASQFRNVAEQDDLPEAWLNLAAEEAQLGQSTTALDAIHRALRLGSQRIAVQMPAASLALELGARDVALGAFISSVIKTPSLAADTFWTTDPRRAAIHAQVVQGAIRGTDPSLAWEIALMGGDDAAATALAGRASDPGLAGTVVKAWTGDAEAMASMLSRCAANPLDFVGLGWCARLSDKAGDTTAADRYRLWADYVQGGASELGSELDVGTETTAGQRLAGGPADFWGTYTYRRPTPWDVLVPSLVHLVTR